MFGPITLAAILAMTSCPDEERPPVDPFRCVEDEIESELDGQAICLHVEGDGWRVVFPPAPPAQPVPWEGLALS